MSDPEVVVRLLAAIDRVERAAREALTGSGRWVSGPRRDHPGYEVAELRVGWVHTQTQQSAQAHHMAVNDPESVLRLCYPDAPCQRCHGVSDVIKTLARGYGVEDGED